MRTPFDTNRQECRFGAHRDRVWDGTLCRLFVFRQPIAEYDALPSRRVAIHPSMQNSDLPNLFIIGAPKCGTSSVFRWLADHPQVCSSNPKETWYFADRELDYIKVRWNHRKSETADYLRYFEPVDSNTTIKMEGSTHYLYSEFARDFLAQIAPTPQLIVQLREPAKRIWSHFNYVKRRAESKFEVSFSDFVSELIENDTSSMVKHVEDPWQRFLLRNQLNFSDYAAHLRFWLERFPREKIKILVLENVVQSERHTIRDVADWIGVDPDFYGDYKFRRQNVSRSPRAKKLRDQLRPFARLLPKQITAAADRVIGRRLAPLKLSESEADRSSIIRLREYFAPDNQRLAEEYDLDLSAWS